MNKYRPDIDGLRTIAVVPVVLFHAGVPGFTGGYVGVDIFFVISGFLITLILIDELERGTYSITQFYERRIRRIFPALFAMLTFVAIVGILTLLPGELNIVSRSLAGTVFFVSNFVLWRQSDYFSGPGENNPLLHTWSLSVEEQFYIFFPILLVAFYKISKEKFLPLIIAVLSFASLGLAQWVLDDHAPAAFYLLPTRAWELLVGSFLAAAKLDQPRSVLVREALGALGLALLVATITLYDDNVLFPGLSAVPPCLGAALILVTGGRENTAVSRILALKPMVFVGLISYSLYLWHWPLLVFPRLYLARPLTAGELLLAVSTAFMLAIVSFKFVERPFRKRTGLSLKPVFRAAGVSMAVLTIGALILASGIPSRVPPAVRELAKYDGAKWTTVPSCSIKPAQSINSDSCFNSAPGRRGKIVLWGDSHAGQYGEAIQKIASLQGFDVVSVTKAGCPPLPYFAPIMPNGHIDEDCGRRNDAIFERLRKSKDVKVVVMAGRWARFYFPKEDSESRRLFSLKRSVVSDTSQALFESIINTVSDLRESGTHVILLGQAPESEVSLPACLAKQLWRKLDANHCSLRRDTFPDQPFASVIQKAVDASGALYLRPSDILCLDGRCQKFLSNIPVLADTDHLTPEVATILLDRLHFDQLLKDKTSRVVPGGFVKSVPQKAP